MGQGVEDCFHILTMAGEEENTNPKVWEAVAMADHFEKIQKLPDKIDGVPNFRRVPGYKVYCCGQPTITGFEAALAEYAPGTNCLCQWKPNVCKTSKQDW